MKELLNLKNFKECQKQPSRDLSQNNILPSDFES